MKFYINNFSFQSGNDISNHRNLIAHFVDVCERAQLYKFEQLYMPEYFKVKEIAAGLSFVSFIEATPPKDNLASRLRSVLANQLKKISSDASDGSIHYVFWNGIDSEFFKKAHNQNTPVASFRTDGQFDSNEFAVISRTLMEDGNEATSFAMVLNLSYSPHFQVHTDFLNAKFIEQVNADKSWNALIEPLRFTARINQLLTDVKYFEKLNGKGDTNFKKGLFFDTGTEIAEINGWTHDKRVSRINSTRHKKRKVFVARNPTAYLSIDFMHGAFELHDRDGIHIGEYNFTGVNLNSTYKDKSHNIKV